jgi:hypothetical protein
MEYSIFKDPRKVAACAGSFLIDAYHAAAARLRCAKRAFTRR